MSIKIMNFVWECDFDSHSKKLVLLALADNSNDEGYCWPSISTIAKKASVSERWVSTCVSELEQNKWLTIYKRRGNSNYYKISVPCGATPEPTSPRTDFTTTPEPSGGTPLNPLQATPEPTSPKPPRTTKQPPIETPIDIPDFIPKKDWDDFSEMRRAMKKPLTPRAAEILIKKLTDWFAAGYNPEEILQNSIANNWQGLFEPKPKGNTNGKPIRRTESFSERSARKQDTGIVTAAQNLIAQYCPDDSVIVEGFGNHQNPQ